MTHEDNNSNVYGVQLTVQTLSYNPFPNGLFLKVTGLSSVADNTVHMTPPDKFLVL